MPSFLRWQQILYIAQIDAVTIFTRDQKLPKKLTVQSHKDSKIDSVPDSSLRKK